MIAKSRDIQKYKYCSYMSATDLKIKENRLKQKGLGEKIEGFRSYNILYKEYQSDTKERSYLNKIQYRK